jgi:hypothetical protein
LLWKEAKVSSAHAHGATMRVYGATLGGGVEVAGRRRLGRAIAAGLGANSQVHALGDGAVWIADQVAARFGTQGTYTVAFSMSVTTSPTPPRRVPPTTRGLGWKPRKSTRKATRAPWS